MISLKHLLLALALGVTAQAHATTITLNADGQWKEFVLNDFDSLSGGTEWIDGANSLDPSFGTALTYEFTIAQGFEAKLTVVDAGFAGDIFDIKNNGVSLGQTSITSVVGTDTSNDFDANLANSSFSSRVFTLQAGTYSITGNLFSTTQAFNATNGALKLEQFTTAVPEESTFAMLLAGLGLMAFARRRA